MFVYPVFLAYFITAVLVSATFVVGDDQIDYLKQVKPLLRDRCYSCHGGLKQEAGLRLDTAALAKKGGDSGAAISVGENASHSLLVERVATADLSVRMPPEHEGEPLTVEQVEMLRKWIAGGASSPHDEPMEPDARDHWAFRAVTRPSVPVAKNVEWIKNPIDSWVSWKHQQMGLVPQPAASKLVQLRRLHLDLIGLPPTREEIAACLGDSSPNWYEATVDRLLDDPRYGERWARHWMDIWRYSDWWGLDSQLRNSQQHIWHWRDWIIESLNQDLPYDQMLRMMLAADELAPEDSSQLRATGYLARNYYIFNRTQWLDETVEHVGKGILGLTFNCAKCHDHKYDPLEQVDYYKLRAVFEPYQVRLDMVPGEIDLSRNGIPRVFDGLADAPTWRFIRGDETMPDKSESINPGIPEILAFDELHVRPVPLPPVALEPALREGILETHVQHAQKNLEKAQAELERARISLKSAEQALAAPLAENSKTSDLRLSTLTVKDDFSSLNSRYWQVVQGEWSNSHGYLEQREDGPRQSTLRLIPATAEDFEATIRLRITGGSRWRSVGLIFDSSPGQRIGIESTRENGNLVYLSGAEGDAKAQGAFWKDGQWHYPSDAKKSLPVKLGQTYTLTIRVRGNLVNCVVDGSQAFVWRLPLPRQPGSIQLFTFDANAAFHEFDLKPLSADVQMLAPEASGDPARELANELQLAELVFAEADASLKSVQARAAAMRANWNSSSPQFVQEARLAAIRSEQSLAAAQCRVRHFKSQQSLDRIPLDQAYKRGAAEEALRAAEADLQKSLDRLESEVEATATYSPLTGARWSATRFRSTERDDADVPFTSSSTGRRTALANWITDRRNPLTARVAVNHIWGRHFGEPLVSTTFDLGRNGATPTHPELLDWLACELMDNGWSMKHLHRLIVTSATYRMSSSTLGVEANQVRDPDNRGLWRRTPIRLESQVVRDSLLSLSGVLDSTIGGPSIQPKDQEASRRRSLYFFHSNNDRNLFLTVFDEALVSECYRREQSIVPQQALALFNSGLALDAATRIAGNISEISETDEAFVRNAFLQLLGFEAASIEIDTCLKAMAAWKTLPESSTDQARASLVWSLINHNDFVTLR